MDAAGRQMNACGVCDTTTDSVRQLLGEVVRDILMNGYPDQQGYLALWCGNKNGTISVRVTDHGMPRNIFEEPENPVAGRIRAEMDESSYVSVAGENILQMKRADTR